MIHIKEERLDLILSQLKGKEIIVLGDIMIDEYLWGAVNRLSPEAPVPVIEIGNESLRFGGAANVALNLKTLGCEPIIIGIIGKDKMANRFFDLMEEHGLVTEGIVEDDFRPTTVKTRIIGDNQHIARVDREKIQYVEGRLFERIKERIDEKMDKCDAIILQDYNKGVLHKDIISHTLNLANSLDKISTVDPKFLNFLEFTGSTVFKPNIKETSQALTCAIETEKDIRDACNQLMSQLNVENVLLTLGANGMALLESDGNYSHVSTKTRKVADVSGAGDTVVASLTAALVGGANSREAASIANYAAGIVCEEVGIIPIDVTRLHDEIKSREGYV